MNLVFRHGAKDNMRQIIKTSFILISLLLPFGRLSAQTIIIPEQARKGCVKAAEELSLHIGKATGKAIAIQKESGMDYVLNKPHRPLPFLIPSVHSTLLFELSDARFRLAHQ